MLFESGIFGRIDDLDTVKVKPTFKKEEPISQCSVISVGDLKGMDLPASSFRLTDECSLNWTRVKLEILQFSSVSIYTVGLLRSYLSSIPQPCRSDAAVRWWHSAQFRSVYS